MELFLYAIDLVSYPARAEGLVNSTRCRTVASTAWKFQKCIEPRRHSPKKECLKCQAVNIAPPERVRAWGDGPRHSRMLVSALRRKCWAFRAPALGSLNRLTPSQDTPNLIRVPVNTASRNMSWPIGLRLQVKKTMQTLFHFTYSSMIICLQLYDTWYSYLILIIYTL